MVNYKKIAVVLLFGYVLVSPVLMMHIEKTAFERGNIYGASYMAGAYDKTNGRTPSPVPPENIIGYMEGYNYSRPMSHSHHYYIGDKVKNSTEYYNTFKAGFSGTIKDIYGGEKLIILLDSFPNISDHLPNIEEGNGLWTSDRIYYRDSLSMDGKCYLTNPEEEIVCPINEYWTEPAQQGERPQK